MEISARFDEGFQYAGEKIQEPACNGENVLTCFCFTVKNVFL